MYRQRVMLENKTIRGQGFSQPLRRRTLEMNRLCERGAARCGPRCLGLHHSESMERWNKKKKKKSEVGKV